MERLKVGDTETDVFASEVVQELKSQIGKEQKKLIQVSPT